MTSRAIAVSLLALSACAGISSSRASSASPSPQGGRDVMRVRSEQEKEEYRAALAAATKRGAREPIEIVVCGATVPEELSEVLDVNATIQAIARELWDEPLFRVRSVHAVLTGLAKGIDACVATASARGFVPDVWVSASAEKDDATERIKKTGNLMAAPTLTVKVAVASAHGSGRSMPSASGPISDALTVVVDAAREARASILDDIAPELPAHSAALLGIGEDARTAMSIER